MFKLFMGKLGEFVSSRVVETFWSKVVDRAADNAVNNVSSIKNFDLDFKTLLQDLKTLSARASDVKDQIKSQELSGRKKRKRQVEEWLEQVKSVEEEVVELEARVESEGFIARLEDGGNVEELNEQVLKLVEQRPDVGELVLDVHGGRGEGFLTDGMVGQAFHKNLETILQLLETREVLRIGVYGMGGVGKTTLAKHINNRLLQESTGRRVLWVTVSQEFTITSLQDKIAHLLGVDLSDEYEVPKRAIRLHSALSGMRDSVLILDDVWDYINLLEVGCSFSRDCCRLIITSRSLEVCRQICCEEVFHVGKLGGNEAWELFNGTLGGNVLELGPQVIEISKSVAKLCDGLPLGIVMVARSMRGEKAIHTWNNALLELKESVAGLDGMGDIKVHEVLKYSFDRLKRKDERGNNEFNMIQRCFMHCSLYYQIARDALVINFISDGLLDERRSRRSQVEQGHSILDKLVNLCLLESCVDFEEVECVKMHDLVRAMALKIAEGKYMVRVGQWSWNHNYVPDGKKWTKDLEKVSFQRRAIGRIKDGASPDCPNLSSLFLRENKLNYIPDSFFSKMQGLCTLDLSWNCDLEMIPDTIGHMTSLKALLLEGCKKLEIVPYLGKLKAMRELNLSGTAIKEVPQGVEELSNLIFFSIDAPKLKLFPKRLLVKLGHLEHLTLPFHVHVEIEEMKSLKRLEEFHGGLKTVSDFNWFIRSRVHHPCYRIAVNLENAYPILVDDKRGDLGGKNNELVLRGSNLSGEIVLGQGIAHLRIMNCEGLNKCFADDLSRLDNPISLKSMCIEYCGGTEYILRSSDGEGLAASQFSNTLEMIRLWNLYDMKAVAQRGETVDVASAVPAQPLFSFLKRLVIYDCNKMGKVGLPTSGFHNLEIIVIIECEEIEEIFTEDEGRAASFVTTLPKLQELNLVNLPKLKVGLRVSGVPNLKRLVIMHCPKIKEIFQEDAGRNQVTTLPRLQSLYLEDLPTLESLSKATIICNSICEITIKGCPMITKLPVHMHVPPPLLKKIRVEREWWESLEWDIHSNLPQHLLPFLRFQDF